MIPAERFYREQILSESLERLVVDIALLSPGLPETSLEFLWLEKARRMLHLTINALVIAKAQSRAEYQPELLEAQLKASLELLHSSPERLRAEENGELA